MLYILKQEVYYNDTIRDLRDKDNLDSDSIVLLRQPIPGPGLQVSKETPKVQAVRMCVVSVTPLDLHRVMYNNVIQHVDSDTLVHLGVLHQRYVRNKKRDKTMITNEQQYEKVKEILERLSQGQSVERREFVPIYQQVLNSKWTGSGCPSCVRRAYKQLKEELAKYEKQLEMSKPESAPEKPKRGRTKKKKEEKDDDGSSTE